MSWRQIMKKLIIATVLATSVLSTSAMAGNHYYAYGKVVNVQPVYQYVTISSPQRECYSTGHKGHRNSAAPPIVGTIVGGVIGNALGHNSSSRKAGTFAGAVIGGSIGHDIGSQNHGSREYCEVSYAPVEKVRELKGYDVKYRYKGEVFSTFTSQRPGDKIKLKINVTPTFQD
jgi:uncharacterized protein YcfJ